MLNVGDTIKCHDATDGAETALAVGAEGYDWDFEFERDGQKGIWIVITGVPDKNEEDDRK